MRYPRFGADSYKPIKMSSVSFETRVLRIGIVNRNIIGLSPQGHNKLIKTNVCIYVYDIAMTTSRKRKRNKTEHKMQKLET